MGSDIVSKRIGFIIALFLISAAFEAPAGEAAATISVNGSAEISVTPDKAVLDFAIESRRRELNEVVTENDRKIKAVVEFLRSAKIPARNIRTELIQIQPIMSKTKYRSTSDDLFGAQRQQTQTDDLVKSDWGVLKPSGYYASRSLSVTITDLEQFEVIYRGIIERGVDTVTGVRFATSDLRQHRAEARLQAVRDGRAKATAMAAELGASLAAVQSISEHAVGRYGGTGSGYGDSPFDAAENAAVGRISVTAAVSIVFELGNVQMEMSP